MAASLLGLGLLCGSDALGQTSPRSTPVRQAVAQTPAPPLAGPAPRVERIRPVAATAPVAPEIRLVGMQQPAPVRDLPTQDTPAYDLLVAPPGPQRVFRLDSESAFHERLRQEYREGRVSGQPERIDFPEMPVLSTESHVPGRKWEQICHLVEPNYVCHGKLLFEDKNSERYGWDLGFVQPAVSFAGFAWDAFFLPYHCATAPGRPECSAGYRLPGDPVPYMLYPPELSVTGLWGQSAAMLLGYRYFPGQSGSPPSLRISFDPTETTGAAGTGLGFPAQFGP